MAKAIYDAKVSPYDIGLVNCHATSTDVGDVSELNALKNLFGNKKFCDEDVFRNGIKSHKYEFKVDENDIDKERLGKLVINANKTFFGHLLGAAGSVETIFAILAMVNKKIISNINTKSPITDLFNFHYNNIKSTNNASFNYCIKNSFAFGGVNTSVLFKKLV
jgi:3-oxoacyl-[acyl-carrier-protein] synthase II